MSATPPRQSRTRACPYCEGKGCEECDGTGQRVRTHIDAGDGVTLSVSGSAPLSDEDVEALKRIGQAAIEALPAEDQARYEDCKQSVVDARRSAERNEGKDMIG